MEITHLFGSGQITIPQTIRNLYEWRIGQKFTVENREDGIFLKPVEPFPRTRFEDVAGCLKDKVGATPLTIEEMDDAIRRGIEEQWRDSN